MLLPLPADASVKIHVTSYRAALNADDESLPAISALQGRAEPDFVVVCDSEIMESRPHHQLKAAQEPAIAIGAVVLFDRVPCRSQSLSSSSFKITMTSTPPVTTRSTTSSTMVTIARIVPLASALPSRAAGSDIFATLAQNLSDDLRFTQSSPVKKPVALASFEQYLEDDLRLTQSSSVKKSRDLTDSGGSVLFGTASLEDDLSGALYISKLNPGGALWAGPMEGWMPSASAMTQLKMRRSTMGPVDQDLPLLRSDDVYSCNTTLQALIIESVEM